MVVHSQILVLTRCFACSIWLIRDGVGKWRASDDFLDKHSECLLSSLQNIENGRASLILPPALQLEYRVATTNIFNLLREQQKIVDLCAVYPSVSAIDLSDIPDEKLLIEAQDHLRCVSEVEGFLFERKLQFLDFLARIGCFGLPLNIQEFWRSDDVNQERPN